MIHFHMYLIRMRFRLIYGRFKCSLFGHRWVRVTMLTNLVRSRPIATECLRCDARKP